MLLPRGGRNMRLLSTRDSASSKIVSSQTTQDLMTRPLENLIENFGLIIKAAFNENASTNYLFQIYSHDPALVTPYANSYFLVLMPTTLISAILSE
jgi:hypothetical protein